MFIYFAEYILKSHQIKIKTYHPLRTVLKSNTKIT